MRFKLFVVCALACGFMAYVLANENVSTEVEDLLPANKAPKIAQAAEFVEIPVEVPKKQLTPADKKAEKVSPQVSAPVSAPASASAPVAAKLNPEVKPVVKVAVTPQKLMPVASSRGTDDILTVAGLKPQPMSGAMVMPFEYLGELYDVDSTGYNWGKLKSCESV
ncbi:hypothetical protein ACLKA7_009774 [Drosophila subpalustris]